MNQRLFNFNTIIAKDSEKELWVDVGFPLISSAKDSLGKIPMGINPTDQTTIIGNFANPLCQIFCIR
jgi:hypothetical protein